MTTHTSKVAIFINVLVTWCNDNHLKFNFNRTNELVVDHHASNSETWSLHTHILPGSAEDLCNLISPSVPELWSEYYAVKVKMAFDLTLTLKHHFPSQNHGMHECLLDVRRGLTQHFYKLCKGIFIPDIVHSAL